MFVGRVWDLCDMRAERNTKQSERVTLAVSMPEKAG